jgi:hypothetical protein
MDEDRKQGVQHETIFQSLFDLHQYLGGHTVIFGGGRRGSTDTRI